MLSTIDLIFVFLNFCRSIAGVFCAIVSHPADTVVSKLNQDKGSTAGQVVKKLGFAGEGS
jgi:solute carrier family 25 phosphate transporter 3